MLERDVQLKDKERQRQDTAEQKHVYDSIELAEIKEKIMKENEERQERLRQARELNGSL